MAINQVRNGCLVHSECEFLKSCKNVKQMGIEVRNIRKLLVSNLMSCMEENHLKAVPTQDRACQVKTVHTRDASCQGKIMKSRDVGCQIKGSRRKSIACQHEPKFGRRDIGCQADKRRKTKDASIQHTELHQEEDNWTNSANCIPHTHKALQRSSQQKRKRVRDNYELDDCARVRPKVLKKTKTTESSRNEPTKIANSTRIEMISPLFSVKKRNTGSGNSETKLPSDEEVVYQPGTSGSSKEDRVLSSFSPKEQQETTGNRVERRAIMPSPDNYIHLPKSPSESVSQTKYASKQLSDCRTSPEIPRQDSMEFPQATSSDSLQGIVKQKSLSLVLRKCNASMISLHSTCVKAKPHPKSMNKGAISSSPSNSAIDNSTLPSTTLKMEDAASEFISTPQKKKKNLRNRKLESVKLSIVDDKNYSERGSAIRMDTSVLTAPKLQQSSFIRH